MSTKNDQKHSHAHLYKKGVEAENGHRRREETTIRIRKEKRAERLNQRRKTSAMPITSNMNIDVQLLYTGSDAQKLDTLTKIRKILSIDSNPPIEKVVQSNLLPVIVSFLQRHDNYKLQFEAAWTLTNVASGDTKFTQAVVNANALPSLISLLDSPYEDVKEQTVWALGNIAGDCIALRDLVIQHGIVDAILRNLNPTQQRIGTLRNMAWTLSNVCRGKPAAPPSIIWRIIPALTSLLQNDDDDVLSDSLWGLCYITDGSNEQVDAVVSTNVCMRIVELMNHPNHTIQTPALRTIGNIVTGSDQATQTVIDCGAIMILKNLLGHQKKNIKKEAVWTLSNMCAGTTTQIQSVISTGVIPDLISIMQDEEFSIRKEATWAISNATSTGTDAQIEYLVVTCECCPALTDMLDIHDVKIIGVVLEAFENILKSGKHIRDTRGLASNPYTDILETCGALDKLEELQSHEFEEIYARAVRILERFFSVETVEDIPDAPMTFDFSTGFAS